MKTERDGRRETQTTDRPWARHLFWVYLLPPTTTSTSHQPTTSTARTTFKFKNTNVQHSISQISHGCTKLKSPYTVSGVHNNNISMALYNWSRRQGGTAGGKEEEHTHTEGERGWVGRAKGVNGPTQTAYTKVKQGRASSSTRWQQHKENMFLSITGTYTGLWRPFLPTALFSPKSASHYTHYTVLLLSLPGIFIVKL